VGVVRVRFAVEGQAQRLGAGVRVAVADRLYVLEFADSAVERRSAKLGLEARRPTRIPFFAA